MRKILSILVICGILCSTLFSGAVSAAESAMIVDARIVEITVSGKAPAENKGLPLDVMSTASFNQSPSAFVNYDIVLLNYNSIDSIDMEAVQQILQNGAKLVVYGNYGGDIDFSAITNTFGEGRTIFDDGNGCEIAAVIISVTNMDNLAYSMVFNVYGKEAVYTDIVTGIETIKPLEIQAQSKMEKPFLVEQVNSIYQNGNTAPAKYETIGYQIPKDGNAYLQIPPINAYAEHFDVFYVFKDGTTTCAVGKSMIYLYNHGRPQLNAALHEWCFYSHMQFNADNDYMIDYVDTRLDGKYYNQVHRYNTALPSNSSLNVSSELGATIGANGMQIGLGLSVGFSIPTGGITIDQSTTMPTNVFYRFKATTDAMHRFLWTMSGHPKNNELQQEGFLTVRGKHTDGVVKGKRDFDLRVMKGQYVLGMPVSYYTVTFPGISGTFTSYYTVYP